MPCLKAWAESFGGVNYPLLSDFWPHGKVAELYGVLRSSGSSERALFLIDKQGIIRYIDIHAIDQQPDNQVLIDEICKMDPAAAARRPVEQAPAAVALPEGGVVLYCTSWCPDCKRARAWLKAQHIEYTEVDITATPGAALQVRKWANGSLTTPLFNIDGTIILNFDEARLKSALHLGH